ncbi:MAG: NAD(P)-binding protein, partial [Candidatus Aminicenantales bacterium]
MKSIAILGAGPTGLSTAYHLKRDYSLWEKNKEIGGGCRTVQLDGFSFDYGGHIFYARHQKIRALIDKLLKNNLRCLPREAWIYSKGTFTRY